MEIQLRDYNTQKNKTKVSNFQGSSSKHTSSWEPVKGFMIHSQLLQLPCPDEATNSAIVWPKSFSSQHNFPHCVNASGIWTWNYIPSQKDLVTQWPWLLSREIIVTSVARYIRLAFASPQRASLSQMWNQTRRGEEMGGIPRGNTTDPSSFITLDTSYLFCSRGSEVITGLCGKSLWTGYGKTTCHALDCKDKTRKCFSFPPFSPSHLEMMLQHDTPLTQNGCVCMGDFSSAHPHLLPLLLSLESLLLAWMKVFEYAFQG
jgi:hypothetical protein